MKKSILQLLIMLSKFALYGGIIQCFLISILLAYDGSAQNSTSVRDYMMDLKVMERPLSEVLDIIEKKSEYSFFYDDRIVKRIKRVSINKEDVSLADILMEISKQTNLKFRQINDVINVNAISENAGNNQEAVEIVYQTTTVTGRVITSEDNTGLPGTNVVVKGTSQGTVTDMDGNYRLDVPASNAILVFSSVGYISEEVSVGNQSVVNITLSPDITSLSEIVVVGYGVQEKRDITGAVSQVKSEEIQNLPVAGIDRALQGRAAGVVISANSGAPGSGTTVRIRGNSSIYGNNDPLYVIDGVPLGENIGGIENIVNPADVESIEILKDASAAAIYGSRGANGVVLITTRKGTTGAPRVFFNSFYGVKNAWRRPELANASEFARTHLLAHQNGGTTPIPAIAAVDPNSWGEGTDWWDVINQTGSVQNYDFSMMGGTEKVKYSTSLNYFKDKGYIKTSEFDRLTFRINSEYQMTKNIKFGNNLSLIHNSRTGISE
ncbi:MAG: SusC/RagA family TonB-linked outer membrane protein, partial [Cyclobacteriaceae bacterium]